MLLHLGTLSAPGDGLGRKEVDVLVLVFSRTIKLKPGLRRPPGSIACQVRVCLCTRWATLPTSGMRPWRSCSHLFGQQPTIALHQQGSPPLLPMRSNRRHRPQRRNNHLSTKRWIRALNLSQWSTSEDHPTCTSTDLFFSVRDSEEGQSLSLLDVSFLLQSCGDGDDDDDGCPSGCSVEWQLLVISLPLPRVSL